MMKLLLLVLIALVIVVLILSQYVSAEEPKPRLVVFTATWCGACKTAKPIIDAIEAKGYKVTRYDADEQPEVLRQYKVRLLPTFIIYHGDKTERTNYIEVVRAYFE